MQAEASSMASELNYKTHRILVPGFHFVLAGILVLNFLYRGYLLLTEFNLEHGMSLLLAVAFVLMFWYMRIFPLRAQDRVIRLETQLRLQRLLPEDLQARFGELRRSQVVGLRFASDEELPGLVRQALDQGLSGEDIKKKIEHWQVDAWRF